MNRFHYFLLSGGLCLILLGCDSLRKEIDPDRLNREAAKLVVTCFLSPQDTVLAVKVARSQPVLGEDTGYGYTAADVRDATTTLSSGGKSVALQYDGRVGYYRAGSDQLPIVAGQTYTLTVLTPAGERATASCTIPGSVALTSVTFDSLTENQYGRQVTRYFVRGRWQDPAGPANNYQITGQFQYVPICTGCEKSPNYKETEQYNPLYFDGNTTQTDRSTQGGEMISERAFLGGYYFGNVPQSGFGSQYKSATVTINLLNTDLGYYQYQDAVQRQSQVVGNPFAESVPVPTNIQGAFGCFVGYNRSTMVMKLK